MSQSTAQRVGRNVRAELARAGKSQAVLGEHLGKSQMYVHRRITGQVAFNVAEIESAAALLGVSVAVLIGSEVAA